MLHQRPLGTTEHLWLRMGQIDSNNFLMVAKVSGYLSKESVKNALRELVQAQGILRSRVDLNPDESTLQVLEKLEVNLTTIERKSDQHWKALAEQELQAAIAVENPVLWRLHWLKGESQHEFILTFNHMIADGRSGANFFDALFQKVTDPDYKIPHCTIPLAYEEQLCRSKQRGNYILGWLKELRYFVLNSRKSWFKLNDASLKAEGTGFVHSKLDAERVGRLLECCRSEKTTISQYLAALMVNQIDGQSARQSTGLSLAVDTRPYLKTDHTRDIGYFVTTVDLVKGPENKSDAWEMSRQFKETTFKKLNKPYFKFEQLIRKLALKASKTNDDFKALIRKTVNNSMMLTNIGNLRQQAEFAKFKVNACFHVPAVHLVGVPFLCLATSTLGGEMALTLTYPKAHIQKSFAERFLEDLIQSIADC